MKNNKHWNNVHSSAKIKMAFSHNFYFLLVGAAPQTPKELRRKLVGVVGIVGLNGTA